LREEREALARPGSSVAFIGEFNAGKSSLIDCVLDEPLMPVGRFPETGAVVKVMEGDEDGVTVRFAGKIERRALEPTALKDLIRLTQDGRRVATESLPDEVCIVSRRAALGRELTLIDTPGLNDDEEMMERALRAAQSADAVVYVTSSKHFLTMSDMQALRELNARRGLQGLLVVVNEFLGEDSAAEFEARQGEDRSRCLSKLNDLWAELGVDPSAVPLVSVSARAAGVQPQGFGGPELRALLRVPGRGNWEALREVRRSTSVRRGHAHVHAAAALKVSALKQQHSGANLRWERYQAAVKARNACVRGIETAVEKVIKLWRDEAQATAEAIAAPIRPDNLRRDAGYGAALRTKLATLGPRAFGMLKAELELLVTLHQQLTLSDATLKELAELLNAGADVHVPVPDSRGAARAKGAAAGAAAGGVFAWLGFPVLVGGAIGYAAGNATANRADSESAARAVRAAAARAAGIIQSRKETLTKLAMRCCRAEPEAVAKPDDSQLAFWSQVRDDSARTPTVMWVPFVRSAT
jgi:hypothetical protein